MHETTRTRRLILVALAALLVGGGAACGDDDDAPLAGAAGAGAGAPTTVANEVTTAGGGSASGGGEGASTDGEGSDGEPLATVAGTRQANINDSQSVPLRLQLVRLERVGEMVELTIEVANESEDAEWTPDVVFSGGGYGVGSRYDAAGIGLVDGEAQKIYLPAFDSEDNCLCKNDLNNEKVAAGGTLTITATYGGVPDDLATVDVQIPNFPTMSGIEVE